MRRDMKGWLLGAASDLGPELQNMDLNATRSWFWSSFTPGIKRKQAGKVVTAHGRCIQIQAAKLFLKAIGGLTKGLHPPVRLKQPRSGDQRVLKAFPWRNPKFKPILALNGLNWTSFINVWGFTAAALMARPGNGGRLAKIKSTWNKADPFPVPEDSVLSGKQSVIEHTYSI